jgi:hypothetical protein
MPYYANSEQFYSSMQMLFERLRYSEVNPVDKLAISHLLIVALTGPTAEIGSLAASHYPDTQPGPPRLMSK